MKELKEQVDNQKLLIEELKHKLSTFNMNSIETNNEKVKKLQEEMKTTYESKIQALE